MLMQASPHPAAIDWQHRASINGGLTHNLHRDAASNLLRGMEASGLGNQVLEVYAFLGSNLAAVCTKLKYGAGVADSCLNTGFASANILDFGGLKDAANTSKRLNTQLNPITGLAGQEARTGTHWYTRDTAASGASQVAVGSGNNAGNVFACGWVSTGTKESGAIAASTTTIAVGTSPSTAGFHGAQNNNQRRTQYYLNGIAIGGLSPTGTGTWLNTVITLFTLNLTTAAWKRDLLYADITVGATAQDCLNLSNVVTQFQRFLNRA